MSVFRLATLALVAAGVLTARRAGPMAAIGAGVAAETVVFAVACLRARRASRGWVVIDLCMVAAALLLSLLPSVSGPPGESPFYGLTLMAGAVVGVADWPLWTALTLATVPAVINAASALVPERTSYPAWNAIPDSAAILGSVLIIWVLCATLRWVGAAHDRHREVAVEQAALLGRERERLRYAEALRERLLTMLERLAEPGAVPDSVLTDQLRQETAWLRDLVSGAPTGPVPALGVGLAALAERMARLGLVVTVEAPAAEAHVPEPARAALLDAAGEALTNVLKHARVGAAELVARVESGEASVEVRDRGVGYPVGQASTGLGQRLSMRQRMAEVGGSAEIRSTPGVGTTVVLRAPTVPLESP